MKGPMSMTDLRPEDNGVVPEGVAAEATALTYPQFQQQLEAEEIARGAEELRQLLQRVQHDPVLFPVMQDHFQPVIDPLRRTAQGPDIDEATEEYPWGDAFNARALVQAHRHELRYCFPWKAWLIWDDTHWKRDETKRVWQWLRHTLVDVGEYVKQTMPDDNYKAFWRHFTRSLQTPRMEGALKAAESWHGISIGQEPFDVDPWLLNCPNGTLDLRTGAVSAHHPGDFLTKCLDVVYDPSAPCPEWERFLQRIMGFSQGPDTPEMGCGELENRRLADKQTQELIDFLQRFVGYALTGITNEQCFCFLYGSGANGKSTFLETLRALLGDYALSTPSASLLSKERHDAIPNDIARLRGARLVTAVEMGEGKKLDEQLLKRLTGQDAVTARFLRQEFFEFLPQFKLLVACNHLPSLDGSDPAIWRRIHCVPFAVTIPEHEQDKDLSAKLRQELPGILAWAVRGCMAWQQGGLQPPGIVQRTTAAYRSDMDSVGRFLEECCVRIDQASVKAGDLYDAYKDWCSAGGESAMTLKAMSKRLDERGIEKYTSNYVWRRGIGLKDRHAGEEPPRF
jgi:putative DNA primase/helicase